MMAEGGQEAIKMGFIVKGGRVSGKVASEGGCSYFVRQWFVSKEG